jgi:hypothetical protein
LGLKEILRDILVGKHFNQDFHFALRGLLALKLDIPMTMDEHVQWQKQSESWLRFHSFLIYKKNQGFLYPREIESQ